ncbi:GPROR8.2 family protein [Megaselia abdita]
MSQDKHYLNDDFLGFTKFVWKTTGIGFEKNQPRGFFNTKSFIKYLGYTNLNLAIIGEILYFIFNFTKFKSFLEMTDVMSYISLFGLAQIKVYKIISRRELIESLMERIDRMFPLNKQSQMDHHVNSYYKRVVYGVMLPLTIFTVGAVFIVVSMPVIKSIVGLLGNGVFEKRLPFLIWYPFDVDSAFVYMFVLIHQGYAGFIAAMSLLTSDLMLCYMTLQICMQFTGLCSKLKAMEPKGTRKDIENLNNIIKQHDVIMKLTDDINEIFRVAVFINFLSAGGVICFAGFQIKEGVATDEIIRYVLNMTFISIQVWILSNVGQSLKDNSLKVGDAAYEQNWSKASVPYRRSLIILIQRSQYPSTLRGITTNSVDLTDFRNVLYNGYRFFALLNTIYTQNKGVLY